MVGIDSSARIDSMSTYLWEHAHVHSRAVATLPTFAGLEDMVVRGLSEEQLRQPPSPTLNSIAWLLWHMARCEDVGINALIAGRPQVLDEEDWRARMRVRRSDIGTGMTADEVAAFNACVDVAALRAYRAAVGRRTREIVPTLRREALEEPVPKAYVEAALDAGALGPNAGWVKQLWQGTSGQVFLWIGTGHNYFHLGEAVCIRSQAGVAIGL